MSKKHQDEIYEANAVNEKQTDISPEPVYSPDPARAERIRWWQKARFGALIIAGPGDIYEWGSGGHHIAWGKPWKVIEDRIRELSYSDYNPKRIARQIKDAGFKYVVCTVKHHEGFCYWDTATTDFKITNTPYGEDMVRQLCEALRAEGLPVGIYLSAWDWSRREYRGVPKEASNLLEQKWGVTTEEGNALWPKFLDFYYAQVEELLTNYGRIDVFWLDGGGRGPGIHDPNWDPKRMWDLVRRLQPQCLLNDRWAGGKNSDFFTYENRVAGTDPGVPWETCHSSHRGGWFYRSWPYYTTKELIAMLIESVAKNGNLLLGMSLDPWGKFPDDAVEQMSEIGQWLKVNGESIYGCRGTPHQCGPYGWITRKDGHIYLHVLPDQHKVSQPLQVMGLATVDVRSVKLLGTGQELDFAPQERDLMVYFPAGFTADPLVTVVDLKVMEPYHWDYYILP